MLYFGRCKGDLKKEECMSIFRKKTDKRQDAIDELNRRFENTQRIARGEKSTIPEEPGEFLVAAIVLGVTDPDDDFCRRTVSADPLWKTGRAGRVHIHPAGGWDRATPTPERVTELLQAINPDMAVGLRSAQLSYKVRTIDKDHLLITVYGGGFWKQLLSIE
jgi:hypothetical protein